jgi:hypothetical protein
MAINIALLGGFDIKLSNMAITLYSIATKEKNEHDY